jgi:hypothetical protein
MGSAEKNNTVQRIDHNYKVLRVISASDCINIFCVMSFGMSATVYRSSTKRRSASYPEKSCAFFQFPLLYISPGHKSTRRYFLNNP